MAEKIDKAGSPKAQTVRNMTEQAPAKKYEEMTMCPPIIEDSDLDEDVEVYEGICKVKGLKVAGSDDTITEQEKPTKVTYRYTLEEMKSYNTKY